MSCSSKPSHRGAHRRRWRAIFATTLVASVLGTVAEGVLSASPASAAGQPAQIAFTTEPPASTAAGQAFPLAVSVEDAQGNVVTGATDSITLTQDTYAPNSGFACAGGFTEDAVDGVASFSCSIKVSGDYEIGASDDTNGLNNPLTSFMSINPGPAQGLAFTIQPTGASTNAPFLAEVSAVDAYGNAEFSDSSDEVSLALSGGTSGANLSCTPSGATSPSSSAILSFGAADFDCSVDTAGAGYTLVASNPNGSFALVASSAFDVGDESAALVLNPSPAVNVNGNGVFNVDLTLTDAQGHPLAGHQVEIDYGPGQEGSGVSVATDQNGNAEITGDACPPDEPNFQISAFDDTSDTQLETINATCVGVNFPSQDSVGFTDSFSVLSSQPDEPVTVSLAASPQSVPVEAALSGSCTTDASGDLAYGSCNFSVPSLQGVTPPAPVTAFVTVGGGASAASYEIDGFELLPETSIDLTPSAGPPGTAVSISLGGFAAGEEVDVYFGDLGEVGHCDASPSGSCSTLITVPAQPAGSYVVESDGANSGELADATFAETSSVTVTPSDVAPDTNVSLTMAGFAANEVVNATLAGGGFAHCTTDSTGSCTTAALVPGNAVGGADAVIATGASSGDSATTTLTVTGLQLAPSSGVAGGSFTATGEGFQPGETVDFAYNGVKQTSCTASPTGMCSVGITVPAAEAHTYTVIASGETSGLAGMAHFTELADLTLTPASGPEDTPVSASVTGFLPLETVSILNGGSSIGSCTADTTGSCVANLFAPVGGAGTYTLTAHGATSGISASAPFTVTGAALALSPSSGPSGAQISASATDFLPNETVDISYDGIANTQCTADGSGACTATVTVPPGPGGTYTVSANGASGHAVATATFVQTPTLVASPNAGLPGSTFQVVASGYAANDVVDFTYAGGADGSCTADSSGDCTAQLTVPADGPGSEPVTGLGSSGLSATTIFVQTVQLRLTPNTGGVGTIFQASATGFLPAETIEFYFNGTLARECQAGTDGSCTATITVPTLPVASYAVVAQGLSSGASTRETFSIVPVLTLTPDSGAPGSSYTVVATGFQPDLEVYVYFGGVGEAGQCGTDLSGSCTIEATVPPYPAGAVNVVGYQPDSVETANATYDVDPGVTLTPSSGRAGSTVSVTSSGFASTAPNGGAERLFISYGGVVVGECTPTNSEGSCTTDITVPAGQPAGANTVLVFDGTGLQGNATFDQTSATSVAVSPNSGTPGTAFAVTGSGFTPGQTADLYFAGNPTGNTCLVQSDGSCTVSAAMVPSDEAGGTYGVTLSDAGGDSASASFTVQPSINASPDQGVAGTPFTVDGDGFLPNETVTISMDGGEIGSCLTGADGICTDAVAVPSTASPGADVVSAAGAGGDSAQVGFTVLAPAQLSVSPNSGEPGQAFTASGSGFTPGQTADLYFAGNPTGNTCLVQGDGSCTVLAAMVPSDEAGGTYSVTLSDTGGDSASASFTVQPSINANPDEGVAGTPFTVQGDGFLPNETVTISMDGGEIGSCFTGADGVCTEAVAVPSTATPGPSIVSAAGSAGDSASTGFTVTQSSPVVSGVAPNDGPTAGGTAVTITGSGFVSGASVSFGSAAATGVTVVSPTTITAKSPAGAGTVDVTVTTPGGTSATSAADLYSYLLAPTVTAVSPAAGPIAGGTQVTITGTSFAGPASVTFGTTAATNVTVVNSTTITATSPAGAAGTVNVRVTTPGGTSASVTGDHFRYLAVPTVTKVTPASGPTAGGTSVTISGTGFASPASVSFGGVAASNVVVASGDSITATSPAGTGTVDVTVTTQGGTSATSAADRFTYDVQPAVSAIAPDSGRTAGGTAVTITGSGFVSGATVSFGSAKATNVTVVNSTTITATSPAGVAGTVNVTVTTPGGTSAAVAADRFTYL